MQPTPTSVPPGVDIIHHPRLRQPSPPAWMPGGAPVPEPCGQCPMRSTVVSAKYVKVNVATS